MNWYKQSDLSTFLDRNDINSRIAAFKKIVFKLNYLSKYVYQNAPHARKELQMIIEDKKMSSFPEIKEILAAAFGKSLDNYNSFATFCDEAADMLVDRIEEMEEERSEFVEKKLPERMRKRKGKND